jgi:hypothetical protein
MCIVLAKTEFSFLTNELLLMYFKIPIKEFVLLPNGEITADAATSFYRLLHENYGETQKALSRKLVPHCSYASEINIHVFLGLYLIHVRSILSSLELVKKPNFVATALYIVPK